jgi:hypothetical protein
VSNAFSCAKLYAVVVGEVDGVRLLEPDVVRDARPGPLSRGAHRWGTGFVLSPVRRPMLGERSFGHDGAGGQLAFGHLKAEVTSVSVTRPTALGSARPHRRAVLGPAQLLTSHLCGACPPW